LAKLESVASFVGIASIILSIALVTLSWFQFREATRQRNSADKAVMSASDALRQATVARADILKVTAETKAAQMEAERARDETRNNLESLRANTRLLLEMDHLTPKIVMKLSDYAKAEKVRKKLEEFAVPDVKERKKWLESLK